MLDNAGEPLGVALLAGFGGSLLAHGLIGARASKARSRRLVQIAGLGQPLASASSAARRPEGLALETMASRFVGLLHAYPDIVSRLATVGGLAAPVTGL